MLILKIKQILIEKKMKFLNFCLYLKKKFEKKFKKRFEKKILKKNCLKKNNKFFFNLERQFF